MASFENPFLHFDVGHSMHYEVKLERLSFLHLWEAEVNGRPTNKLKARSIDG